MRLSMVAALAALINCLGAAASASVVTIAPSGPGGVPMPALSGFAAVATFDGVTQAQYGSTVPSGSFKDGGGRWSGEGVVMNNAPGTAAGRYAEPLHDTSNYMAVMRGRTETVTFDSLRSELGLYWGSIDAYNVLTLFDDADGSSVEVFAPGVADGSQTSASSNRYFVVRGFDFDRVAFGSLGNSFEFDSVTTMLAGPQPSSPSLPIPEPGEGLMLALGLAALVFARFRLPRGGVSA